MKNFSIGLLTGISLFLFSQYFFPNLTSINLTTQNSQQTEAFSKLKSLDKNTPLKKTEFLEVRTNAENINPLANNQNISDVAHKDLKNQAVSSELRRKISNLVMNIRDEQLSTAIKILNQRLQPRPENIFSSEIRDEEFSSIKEEALEQNFYKYQPYSALADLQSIECKVTICKLTLSTPFNATFDKKKLRKFNGNIILTNFGMKDVNDQVQMTIYVGVNNE